MNFRLGSGFNAGCAMFQVRRADGKFTATELFKHKAADGYLHDAILYQGYLYANGNSVQQPRNGLMCLTLDGQVKWKTGNEPPFDMGNPVLADGLLYVMNGKDGTLALGLTLADGRLFVMVDGGELLVAEATPKEFKELERGLLRSIADVGGQGHGPGVDLLPRTNEGTAGGTLSQDAIPVL